VSFLERPRWARLGGVRWIPIGLVAAVGTVVGSVTWLMEHGSYDTYASIIVGVALAAISIPMLRRAAANENDPRIARLLWIAFCAKLLAALPRYAVAFGLYDGRADAASYDAVGAELARQFREGSFAIEIGRPVQGTGFIQILTGAIYTLIGATDLGGFLVFSWLGFWGLFLFHRAFVRACPDADHFRYSMLVLLLPSLLFWPSSIGKEAWMCFGLGLAAWGASLVLTAGRGGMVVCAAGVVCIGMVRPHISAIVAAALLMAYLLRRSPRSDSGLAPFGKLAVLLVLVGGLVVAVGEVESFLGVDAFDRESVELTLAEVTRQTGQGGSYVEDTNTDLDIRQLPRAFLNVAFRPFPWEATNLQALLAALEGLFLMALFLLGARRLVAAARAAPGTPYLIFAFVYVVLFVYGFSSFANHGILVRQRVQVLPFLLAFVCLRPAGPAERWRGTRSSPTATDALPVTQR
jgi:hypothetical protein